MNGRKLYVRPQTTASGVASTRSPVGEAEPAGDVQDVQGVEDADDRAAVREDRLPGERADQEAGEERRDDQDQHHVAPAARPEGDEIRQRVAEQQAQDVAVPAYSTERRNCGQYSASASQ